MRNLRLYSISCRAAFSLTFSELRSACEGIDRFLISATCVGVRPGAVYSPNGLALLYDGVLSMNPLVPHRVLFDQKARSYLARWPWLRIRSGPTSREAALS